MLNKDLVRDLARRLDKAAPALAGCLGGDPGDLEADDDRRDLVAFRVYLCIQIAIDLASHVITDEGWGPAPRLREHFDILAEYGVLDPVLAGDLAAGVKIRNLVGDAYGDLDCRKLHAAAVLLPDLVRRMAAAILDHSRA